MVGEFQVIPVIQRKAGLHHRHKKESSQDAKGSHWLTADHKLPAGKLDHGYSSDRPQNKIQLYRNPQWSRPESWPLASEALLLE
jgi:hypothetical protein